MCAIAFVFGDNSKPFLRLTRFVWCTLRCLDIDLYGVFLDAITKIEKKGIVARDAKELNDFTEK